MFDAPGAAKAGCLTDSKAFLEVVGFVFAVWSQGFHFEVTGGSKGKGCGQAGVANLVAVPVARVGAGREIGIELVH